MIGSLRRVARSDETVIGTAGLVPLARIPASILREMQYMWTRLMVQGKDMPHSIGVTSQLRREGVSVVCWGLAATLTGTGPTCLIEANWWGAGVPLPESGIGLADLLSGSCSVDDVLVSTCHPSLSVIPSGQLAEPDPTSALPDARALNAVLSGLHERFAHVILDLPALSVATTALSFAAEAEATILVARQRVARLDEVERAIADLGHTRLLGIVLNAQRLSTPRLLRSSLSAV